jgi:H+-transporting ATPase
VRLAAGDRAPADCVLVDHPETTSAIVEVDEEVPPTRRRLLEDEEVPPSVSENNTSASPSARGRRRVVRAGDEIFAGATCVRGETRAVVTRTGAAITRGGGDADGGFARGTTRTRTRTPGGSNATARRGVASQPPRGSLDATLDGFARVSHALCVLACFCVGATLFAFSDDGDASDDGALPLGSDAPRGSAGSDVRAADFLALVSFAAALCVAASPASLPAFRAASDASALLSLRRACGVRHCASASACYDLARCDAVCCDKAGTVTRGACELTGVHATTPGVSSRDVLVAAALATRWRESPRDAVDAMVLRSVDVAPLSESYAIVKHQPFDAASKTTSCTLERTAAEPGSRGTRFRVCKGAPAEVAAVCDNGEACEEACERVLAACADAGERCFAVAANHRDDPEENEAAGPGADDAVDENDSADSGGDGWMLLGLVTFVDPPRADARSSVRRFEDLGVKVVLVTGDAEPAARETCRLIGLRGGAGGDDAGVRRPSDVLPHTRRPRIAPGGAEMDAEAAMDADVLFPCVAFADASPAEKRAFVASLRRERLVAFVGRGVADAAAMGEADVAVAALGASDAALSAADAILGAPGLATLASAIARSRASFAKIRAHVAHRQGSAAHALLFFFAACLFARPRDFDPAWPETFHPPVASVVLIAASLHLTLVAFASDDPSAPVARRPERLRLPALAFAATARGAVSAASSAAFLAVALGANRRDRHGRQDHPIAALVFGGGGAPLAYGEVLTASFLEFSVSSALGAFSARTTGPFWESAPGASALASVVAALFAATALAL